MLQTRKNQSLMPSLFSELLDWNNWNNFASDDHYTMPKMNVSESADNFQLELCVPGLAKEDLNLSIDSENNLVVEMVNKEEKHEESGDRKYLRREFNRTQFKQLLSLPESVKKESISARVENGILYIILPKYSEKEKAALAQRIEIL